MGVLYVILYVLDMVETFFKLKKEIPKKELHQLVQVMCLSLDQMTVAMDVVME
jgi:hypothetical protein